MKTVAVIASCDTKYKEVAYIRDCLAKADIKPLVIDMAVGRGASFGADISREEVVSNIGLRWEDIKDRSKGELIELITEAVKITVIKAFRQGTIDGVLSVGGVQNTMVATTAMKALPIGFPKVMATTIASGKKPFDLVIGDSDIVVIPSISDFTGINMLTGTIIANACACASGLVKYAGRPLQKDTSRIVIGITLMGVTNDGSNSAVSELERLGIDAIGFHSTGVGGRIMEQLAQDGIIDGILDLTTHEITAEYFGGGFSYGAADRLIKPARLGIPMVVSTGGLDFVDFAKTEFPPRMDERVYNMHNGTLAHIKILPDEAVKIGKIFAERLNLAEQGVKLIIPTEGMRKDTKEGQSLYFKEVDDVLIKTIKDNINKNVRLEFMEGNLDDKDWGIRAAHQMIDELRLRGKINKESYIY